MRNYYTTAPLIKFETRPKAFLDTEYSSSAERQLCKPICWVAVTEDGKTFTGDLFNGFNSHTLQWLIDNYNLVCHAASAELGFIHALYLDLSKCQVIDTLIEWRLMTNNHPKYSYGHIISDGKECISTPPLDQSEKKRLKSLETPEGERLRKSQSDVSLRAFVYKMNKVHKLPDTYDVDAERKETMRGICIRYDLKELEENIDNIVKYCHEDVLHLKHAYELLCRDRQYLTLCRDFRDLERGQVSINLHYLSVTGIPLDVEKLKNITNNAKDIILEAKRHCNTSTGLPLFRDETTLRYKKDGNPLKSTLDSLWSFNYKVFEEYIKLKYREFPLTESGKVSTSSDDLELYDFDPVCYHLRQTNKTVKSLQSLLPVKSNGTKKEDYLFDHIGSDGRLRIHNWGVFGTQTGRQAPRASHFILAMSKWLRSLITPPKGWALVEVDFGSQESLLAGIVYDDDNIIKGYECGDPYISFGILAGIVPPTATKHTHAKERKQLKAVTLGKSYGLGVQGLGLRLASELWEGPKDSAKFAKEWTEHLNGCLEKAAELDQAYRDVYYSMHENREERWTQFEVDGYIDTCRYWRIWDALPFKLSILNAPVQGLGAAIYHRMSYLLTHKVPDYVETISFLHDASYCLVRLDKLLEGIEFICDKMLQACYEVVTDPRIKLMRVGIDVISPELDEGELETKHGKAVVQKVFYADDNAKQVFNKLLPYMVKWE